MINFSNVKNGNRLLDQLINQDSYLQLADIEKQLHLSRRSVFYLLKRLNKELVHQNLDPIANIHNIGYYISDEDKASLNNWSNSTQISYSSLTKTQRQNVIIWNLINHDHISNNYLIEECGLSSHTVVSDFNEIRSYLQNYQLSLQQTVNGKKIQGSELSIRKWVLAQLTHPDSIIYDSVDAISDDYTFICGQLHQLEERTKNYFSDTAVLSTSKFILWLTNRIKQESTRLTFLPRVYTASNAITVKWATELLAHFHIDNSLEIAFLAQIINASQFYSSPESDPLIQQILPITNEIIARFKAISGSDTDFSTIKQSLSIHLLNTFYRATLNIQPATIEIQSIISSHPELFVTTQMAIKPFESFANCQLSNTEIGLIAIYFGGQLQKETQSTQHKQSILVVCKKDSGVGELLISQLHHRYPNYEFKAPITSQQYNNLSLKGRTIVVTTLQLKNNLINQTKIIKVSPILTNHDLTTLDHLLKSSSKIDISYRINLESLTDVIANYARIEDVSGLNNALSQFFSAAKKNAQN